MTTSLQLSALSESGFQILKPKVNPGNTSSRTVEVRESASIDMNTLYQKEYIREFLEKENWSEYMSVKVQSPDSKAIQTPMRLMIREYPESAIKVLNKCIEEEKDEIRFVFSYMDDTYSSTVWTGPERLSTLRVTTGDEESTNHEIRQTSDRNMDGKSQGPQSVRCDTVVFRCSDGEVGCEVLKEKEAYSSDPEILMENHPLAIAVQERAWDILCHPLVFALVEHKWKQAGAWAFYAKLMFDFLFVLLLTAHAVLVNENYKLRGNSTASQTTSSESTSIVSDVIGVALLLLTIGQIVMAIYFMTKQGWTFFCNLNNYFRAYIAIATIALVISSGLFSNKLTQYPLAVITVLVTWLNFAWTLQRCPLIGIFFVMFENILMDSFIVLIIFFPILLGFAFTFNILLDALPLFQKGYAIATVLVMLSGEIDYAGTTTTEDGELRPTLKHDATTIIVYVLFIMTIVICMLNLLVSLAVADVGTMIKRAQAETMALKIEEVLSTDFYLLPDSQRRKRACGCLRKQRQSGSKVGKKLLSRLWSRFTKFGNQNLRVENLTKFKQKEPDKLESLSEEISRLREEIRALAQVTENSTGGRKHGSSSGKH